jgi:signal transduction histidine kinase
VLVNLLRNAIRYTPPGGIVVVIATQTASELQVDVRDTGAGIHAEDLPHVWERFYRGGANGSGLNNEAENGEASAGSGAGLGLALVKELTEAMGGRVSVESKPGEGSCFSLYLTPACDNSATKP